MWLHFTQHNLFSKTCLQIVFQYYLLAYSNWWVGLRCNYRLFQLCQWTMAPHCDAPSWAWMSYFLLKWRVPVRRATRAASDKGSSSWAYLWSCLWLASELKAALLDSLIFYEGSREPKQSTTYALSCCFLYTKCFLCFTVLSFNEHTLNHLDVVVKSFLYKGKNPHTTVWPARTCSNPRPVPQNSHCVVLSWIGLLR